ncbi:hypothetical protein FB45DRAFT_876129 [Roridomyces roridus]|uniref:Uncharacterized protein n=1 Tax=Roridomyces roridus TaxID=1738132 RepID=A0AAD7B4X3_9AGAR|nr:hypothetical protein FB45DRAFT_876129 [Roridomyces roridus]
MYSKVYAAKASHDTLNGAPNDETRSPGGRRGSKPAVSQRDAQLLLLPPIPSPTHPSSDANHRSAEARSIGREDIRATSGSTSQFRRARSTKVAAACEGGGIQRTRGERTILVRRVDSAANQGPRRAQYDPIRAVGCWSTEHRQDWQQPAYLAVQQIRILPPAAVEEMAPYAQVCEVPASCPRCNRLLGRSTYHISSRLLLGSARPGALGTNTLEWRGRIKIPKGENLPVCRVKHAQSSLPEPETTEKETWLAFTVVHNPNPVDIPPSYIGHHKLGRVFLGQPRECRL